MAGRAAVAGGAATSSSCSAVLAGDLREVLRRVQSVGYCLDLDSRATTQLDAVFQRILDVFLSDIAQQCAVPTPAMFGDGRPVDLFRLYSLVRGQGGHDAVTAGKLWPKVATRAGFDASAASAIKLVYNKYLEPLDRWFAVVLGKKEADAASDATPAQQGNEVEMVMTPRGSKPGWLSTPPKGRQANPPFENGAELPWEDDDQVVVLDAVKVEEATSLTPSKRKRNELPEMLNWVREVAKKPGHPGLGGKGNSGETDRKLETLREFSLALMVRKELTVKRVIRASCYDSSIPREKQRGHPIFYEDYADRQSDDKLRSSQRILSKLVEDEDGTPSKRLRSCNTKHSSENPADELFLIDPTPHYRAVVPSWTNHGVPYNSDNLKWLGTKIWPQEQKDKKKMVEVCPIGKGRLDGCACEHHGSVECIRLHVAEKRLQLKRELQNAFYSWKFDRMGEEVALAWTEEEEQQFKSIVRLNSSPGSGTFWSKLYQSFPSKSRQTLVSYYFNVFLIRRRCFQNRVTPSHIDSDDEEAEFGFLGSTFGKDAVTVRGSKRIICTENTQCIDLEEL